MTVADVVQWCEEAGVSPSTVNIGFQSPSMEYPEMAMCASLERTRQYDKDDLMEMYDRVIFSW